jgi:hypothetical protein
MGVPLPAEEVTDLTPPGPEETAAISRALAAAVAGPGGLTATQRLLLDAIVPAMTGHPARLAAGPLAPDELAAVLARRDLAFRGRIVQLMILGALVVHPLPVEVADRVAAYARELGVDDGMIDVAQRFAEGSLGLAAFDFQRAGYTAEWEPGRASALHTSRSLADAWEQVVHDPDLAARWRALEALPEGTLGRRVSEFYRARGFTYPGIPGSAPPLLAQHDWVHVLADYGSTVECELEVFAFIARANDDLRAFSLLAMVVSLFETGYLRTGAGLFQSDPGHLSESGMPARLADAMRRGAQCAGSVDYLAVDWFALAEMPVDDARRHFSVVGKSGHALAAGSIGPWESGGLSPYQARTGRALAEQQGRAYQSFGASPARGL